MRGEYLGGTRSILEGLGETRSVSEKLGESRRRGEGTEKAAYGFRQLFIIITCVV
jgi:hypothetical protein